MVFSHLGGKLLAEPFHEPVREAVEPLRGAEAARFQLLVNSNYDFIWRTLRGLGVDVNEVDDAAQHVFLVASQKLASIVPGSERAFLYGTASGVAANARRARTRRRELGDENALVAYVDEAPDPEQCAAQTQARRLLDAVLVAMPDDLRAVFVLCELEGLTMSDAATLLGAPPGTIASRLRRSRVSFREFARSLEGEDP